MIFYFVDLSKVRQHDYEIFVVTLLSNKSWDLIISHSF